MSRNYARSKDGEYKFFDGETFPTDTPGVWAIWRGGIDTSPAMRRIGEDGDCRTARLLAAMLDEKHAKIGRDFIRAYSQLAGNISGARVAVRQAWADLKRKP